MTNFSKIAATSKASGFQNYDQVDYSFTFPAHHLPKVTGTTYSNFSQVYTVPKNRLGKALTSQVLCNIRLNLSPIDAAGQYHQGNSGFNGVQTTGTAGGFPIFYNYNVSVDSDANNIIFTITVGNSSAVNDSDSPILTLSGHIYFYLGPF